MKEMLNILMPRTVSATFVALMLAGCFPAEITLSGANTESTAIKFYPGNDNIDDLLIVDGKNYFGKAQYQIDDPIGDIGFRTNDGRRIQAECVEQGKDIIGEVECKKYEVYRSNFDLIPVGTRAVKPSLF